MNEERKISLCIPTWNRFELLIDSFLYILHDDRISEIIISDDASDLEIYDKVQDFVSGISKIKLYRNANNQDCYKNKMTAISYATNEYCILLDSDNQIKSDYLDLIYELNWTKEAINTPSFASPHFDFREYKGRTITKQNVAEYIDKPMFEVCLNAANYFVNKDEYLRIWDGNIDPVTSDSIYMVSRWLEAGNNVYIVPGLTYEHRVHTESHYQKNTHRTPEGFHQSLLQKLREMS